MAGKQKILTWLIQALEKGDVENARKLGFRLAAVMKRTPSINSAFIDGLILGADFPMTFDGSTLDELAHSYASYVCSNRGGREIAVDHIEKKLAKLFDEQSSEDFDEDLSMSPLS